MTVVGVNLVWLVPGDVGGSEEYLVRQLEALAATDEFELHLFVVRGFTDAHPCLASRCTIHLAPTDGRNRIARVLLERTWLPRAIRRSRADVVHHGGGTAPPAAGRPIVLTIHDVQYTRYPETFRPIKLRWLRWSVPRAIERASVIAVPSRFVADSLNVAGVVVVPNAAPVATTVPTAEPLLRARLGLPGPVLLYPAITYRHKNHAVVIEAVARLARELPSLRLVLTGRAGPHDAEVERLITSLGIAAMVVRPGRLPVEDLDGLYSFASAMVFPSRYEGFGVPVLEAMVHGVPVIAADATALPEAVGAAGLLVDPDDIDGWVTAIRRVLAEPGLADTLIDHGRAHAAAFSTTRSAAALATAYRGALISQTSP